MDAFVKQMKAQGFDVLLHAEGGDTKTHEMIDPRSSRKSRASRGRADARLGEGRHLAGISGTHARHEPAQELIHQKVQGYHPDALKAFSSTSFHGSYQLARLKYGMEMAETLDIAESRQRVLRPCRGSSLSVNCASGTPSS